MSGFLGRFHDAHHTGSTVDLINCPFCQDEFISWQQGEGEILPLVNVDRLEDQDH